MLYHIGRKRVNATKMRVDERSGNPTWAEVEALETKVEALEKELTEAEAKIEELEAVGK